jgi:hypothetical protein
MAIVTCPEQDIVNSRRHSDQLRAGHMFGHEYRQESSAVPCGAAAASPGHRQAFDGRSHVVAL